MKILIRDEQGMRELEEGYASEEELQRFLKEHSDLMPLEEIDPVNVPPPLLCIGWEAHRAVVGQILEYAAEMCSWTSADIERQAERFFASGNCPEPYKGCTLERALGVFLGGGELPPDFSYEDFLQKVQTNIDGQLRKPLQRTFRDVPRSVEALP